MAPSSPRPTAKTASLCTSDTASGTHTLMIEPYSLHSGLGAGKYVRSKKFTVGGHDWCIRYYPDGRDAGGAAASEGCRDHVAVHLELMSEATTVRLLYDFRLVSDQAHNRSDSIFRSSAVLAATAESPLLVPSTCGTDRLMEKSELEHKYLWEDRLEIECDVTVIKESQLIDAAVPSHQFDVQVPPSNLSDDLVRWFTEETQVDITIKVQDEVFRAHRLVLAMRSRVFKDNFYGRERDDGMSTRYGSDATFKVEDMEPDVFKALLHFVYTDTLPEEHKNEEMATKLFVVADNYAMDRMKLYCGSILSKGLTVQSVTTIIELAHKHGCQELKKICTQFIVSSERRMKDVLSSDGYQKLQTSCANVAAEIALQILEKSEIFKETARHGAQGPAYDTARWDFRRVPKYD